MYRIKIYFFPESGLRPVFSMLTFPLQYNFLPLSMRITSWIVKKGQPFFVRLVSSPINLWFSTNQIEETNKQIKLTWREVDHSLMAMLSVSKSV